MSENRGNQFFKEMFQRGTATIEFQIDGEKGMESATEMLHAMYKNQDVMPGLRVNSISGFNITNGWMLEKTLLTAALVRYIENRDEMLLQAITANIRSFGNVTFTNPENSSFLLQHFIASVIGEHSPLPAELQEAMAKVFEYLQFR